MKKLFYIFLFFSSSLFAQNLVPNPSFEQFDTCPDNISQVDRCTGWSSYRPTPDYYNSCSTYPDISIPNNALGYQFPPDSSCNAYCGFATYFQGINNLREFIGAQLISPLIIGQRYYISFKISLADVVNCAIDKLGLRFSTIPYSDSNIAPVDNFSHIYSSSIISSKNNWASVSGSFIADSAYDYVILGNFFDDNNTDTLLFNISFCYSYYFVDDICVSADSLTCYQYNYLCNTSVLETNSTFSIVISPNPTSDKLIIHFSNNEKSNAIMKIFTPVGNVVHEEELNQENNIVYLNRISDGIYLLLIQNHNSIYSSKFIVSH